MQRGEKRRETEKATPTEGRRGCTTNGTLSPGVREEKGEGGRRVESRRGRGVRVPHVSISMFYTYCLSLLSSSLFSFFLLSPLACLTLSLSLIYHPFFRFIRECHPVFLHFYILLHLNMCFLYSLDLSRACSINFLLFLTVRCLLSLLLIEFSNPLAY